MKIEYALDKLFKYERNYDPKMASLVEESYKVRGIGHLNQTVLYNKFEGTIPFLGVVNDRTGLEMAFYTAEKKLSKEGMPLPGDLSAFNDCNYIHLGVLMNCLVYMSGKRINKLTLVQMNGNILTNISYKPMIAELFLSHLVPEDEKKKQKQVNVQHNLFAK